MYVCIYISNDAVSLQNARCAAEQTQTVTREAPTITVLPGNNHLQIL